MIVLSTPSCTLQHGGCPKVLAAPFLFVGGFINRVDLGYVCGLCSAVCVLWAAIVVRLCSWYITVSIHCIVFRFVDGNSTSPTVNLVVANRRSKRGYARPSSNK